MKLIFIVGLPASGKTTFSNKLKSEQSDLIIYDDYLSNSSYIMENVFKELSNDGSICLIDPRLTDNNIYLRHVNRFLSIIDKKNITTYVFSNNEEQCIKNLLERSNNIKSIVEKFKINIVSYSKIYDPQSELYVNPIMIESYGMNQCINK